MRVQRAVWQRGVWTDGCVARRRGQWPLRRDLLAIITICVIFGLQILVLMTSTGGPEIYSAVASEGMQLPQE
jgi:hypothetical protein